MKGDFSRSTFRAERHYASVRQQQGRVQLDADSNEAQDIIGHRLDAATRDIIGAEGAPIDDAGFGLAASGTTLTLTPGRLYVGGTLVENEREVPLPDQPHLGGGWALLPDGEARFDVATPEAGHYAVVLDIWPRHITALEHPALIEPALNGVDTTTRIETVWQAKLLPLAEGTSCAGIAGTAAWQRHMSASSGRLLAATDIPAPSPDACDLSPSGGYQGLENQLYRVEIHDAGGAGGAGAATFKWAPDNASVATLATAWDNARSVSLASMGRDFSTGWRIGDTVELLSAERELRGLPGTLLSIVAIDGSAVTLSGPHGLGAAASGDDAAAQGVRVRRWAGAARKVPATGAAQKLGEDGVIVTFAKDSGIRYRTGDYWTIPARTANAGIDWPGGYQPAEGIDHAYAVLGRIAVDAAGAITVLADCRALFAPLSAMLDFGYAGGDGQQAESRESGNTTPIPLAFPLEASVTRGKRPVAGWPVRFSIEQGPAGLLGTAPGTAAQVIVETAANGIAACPWALDATVGDGEQRVVAELLDDGGQPIAAPIHFGARVLGLLEMHLHGGDTQTMLRQAGEAGPFALPVPLSVSVLRAGRPAKGQRVRFEVTGGGGTLDGGTASRTVTTDEMGLASTHWTLASADEGATVRARLMKDATTGWGLPDIRFSAAVLTGGGGAGGGACDVTIGEGGQFPTLNDALKALLGKKVTSLCLCLMPGTHTISDSVEIGGHSDLAVSLHGCGPATRVIFKGASLKAAGIAAFEMRDLAILLDNGVIGVADIGDASFRRLTVDLEGEGAYFDALGVRSLLIEGSRLARRKPGPVVEIDDFMGARRIEGNEIRGWVSFAHGSIDTVDNLLPALRDHAAKVDERGEEPADPPAGNILTIANNQIDAITLGEKLADAMIEDSRLMPLVSRIEGNVLAAPGTIIPGMAIIFQANSFLAPGHHLMLCGVRYTVERQNIKIVANTGPFRTLISTIGHAEYGLNRPIDIA